MKKMYAPFRPAVLLCCLCFAFGAQAQPASGMDPDPAYKTAGSGYRMIAAANYLYGSGGLAPNDSTQFFFPSLSTDTIDRFDTYTAFGTGTWRPGFRYVYTFDALGRVKQLDAQSWNASAGAYIPLSRQLDSLNSGGQLIRQLAQRWDAPSGSYVNWQQTFFVRNAAHLIMDQLSQTWNGASWVNDRHFVHDFNQQGSRLSSVYQRWKTATNTWRNTDSFSTVYDATGLVMTQSISFGWDTTAAAWKPGIRQFPSYDAAGNRILSIAESFNASNVWVPISKDSVTFTATNNPDVHITKVWNSGSSTYDNQSRTTHIYNSADLPIIMTTERWAAGSWTMSANGASQTNRYYQAFGSAASLPTARMIQPVLRLSPNPAGDVLHFSLSSEAPQSFTASIIDLHGRILQRFSATQAKQYDINLSTSSMPAGSYFVRVITAAGQAISCLLVVRH